MDLHPDETPGLGLPQPSMQQGGGSLVPSSVPVRGNGQPAAAARLAVPSGPQVSADDNVDALDEEWVSKAKAIVERTKNDPYLESKELSKAKADYLRVRYNKQLKTAEEHS